MQIIDDFLDYEEFQILKSEIMNPVFDWNYVPMTDSIEEKSNKFSDTGSFSAGETIQFKFLNFSNLSLPFFIIFLFESTHVT